MRLLKEAIESKDKYFHGVRLQPKHVRHLVVRRLPNLSEAWGVGRRLVTSESING